jgi:hypothetical protein
MMNLEPPSPAAPSCSNCDHAIRDEVREHHQCILFHSGRRFSATGSTSSPFEIASWMGWDYSDTRYHQAEAALDWQANA